MSSKDLLPPDVTDNASLQFRSTQSLTQTGLYPRFTSVPCRRRGLSLSLSFSLFLSIDLSLVLYSISLTLTLFLVAAHMRERPPSGHAGVRR